ncbi:MAG: hypothetical protein ACOCU9_04375, partial [Spirochaetota bacterium]
MSTNTTTRPRQGETGQQAGQDGGTPSGIDQQPPRQQGPGLLERFWSEKKNRLLTLMAGVFLVAFLVPWSAPRVSAAVNEAFLMLGEY